MREREKMSEQPTDVVNITFIFTTLDFYLARDKTTLPTDVNGFITP